MAPKRSLDESSSSDPNQKRTLKSLSHSQQPSTPPPPPPRPARSYDVFLSFRGEDTRNTFVGNLYKALDLYGIYTFKDDQKLDRYGIYTFKDDQKLKKGKTVALAPELLKSIEESRYSIVILSENYATSTWCLDELVKIIHCMDQFGQIVVPIFYNVDPSVVKNQTGSFKRAFDRHERAFKKKSEKVLQWREALRRVGSISGSRNRDESVLIEEIVRDVSDKLFSESSNDYNKFVGMSYHMEQMNFLLCNDGSEKVLMVGIYGMGGIGKTTISKALYDRYSHFYDGRCYAANVKDIFRKHDPSSLQEKLLSEIFMDKNLKIHTLNENVIKERISRIKVFIVLDDVNGVEQLQTLADKHDWFGPGSRIIITTSDQHLLISHGVDYLYNVMGYHMEQMNSSPVSYSQQLSLLPAPSRPARTYDVFLSFRGEDTRSSFVGHLYKALDRYAIYTFRDDQNLNKRKTVAPELLKSIEESRYSIVILSKNYAFSTWCLDELVKIIHCKDKFGQIVVPIFYNVDPTDVRKQTRSFKRAFDHHERAFKKEKLLQWREALTRVGSLSGSDSRNRDESVLIEEIVRDVSDKLFSESSNDDSKLVGMSHHMEIMNTLLCNDGSNEVMMVGISGMGGIGKTTISKALYDRYSHLYDGRCYVANVKDIFRKHDPSSLREKLLSEIFMDRNLKIHTLNDNFNVLKERLSRKKVFIVLDDVDGMEQLETIVDKHELFGPGSRIIITSRDQCLLISHGVDYLYNVMSLRDDEASQLFSQYAFRQEIPTPDYLELSNKFVLYAKGLPLALKVLGSFLYKKSISKWRKEHRKLKKIPNATIQDVLRISFDGLDDEQKDIFLENASF